MVHLDPAQTEPSEIAPGQVDRRKIRAVTFVVFRVQVAPVRRQHLFDLVGGKHTERYPHRKIGHTGEWRSRPFRVRHAAILLRNAPAHDIAAAAPSPYALGRPTMFRAGWSPVGGGNGGHVEMAVLVIFTRLLGVISIRDAEKCPNSKEIAISRSPRSSSRRCGPGRQMDITNNRATFKPSACRNLSSGQASAVASHHSPRRPSPTRSDLEASPKFSRTRRSRYSCIAEGTRRRPQPPCASPDSA